MNEIADRIEKLIKQIKKDFPDGCSELDCNKCPLRSLSDAQTGLCVAIRRLPAEDKALEAEVLNLASRVRRCVLDGDKTLAEIGANGLVTERMIQLAEMLMKGKRKENIIDTIDLSDREVERLGALGVYDW